jgi:hypothetical protein
MELSATRESQLKTLADGQTGHHGLCSGISARMSLPHSQSDGRSEVFTRLKPCQEFMFYLDWLVCFENLFSSHPTLPSGVIVGDTGDGNMRQWRITQGHQPSTSLSFVLFSDQPPSLMKPIKRTKISLGGGKNREKGYGSVIKSAVPSTTRRHA